MKNTEWYLDKKKKLSERVDAYNSVNTEAVEVLTAKLTEFIYSQNNIIIEALLDIREILMTNSIASDNEKELKENFRKVSEYDNTPF